MNWQAITVNTSDEAIEAVSAILMDGAGAEGVQVNDQVTPVKITAYFEDNAAIRHIIQTIKTALASLERYGINASPATLDIAGISEKDWSDNWKAYYHATRITRHLTVVPAWESFLPQQEHEYPIFLNPELSFGTGTHPTTKLMLQALETVVRGGETMLDIGTGSGVLSIAAKQLGVAQILATDVDDDAVQVARDNLLVNPIAQDVKVIVSDLMAGVDSAPVDLIVANILADVIELLIPQIWGYLKPGGYFMVSGIIESNAHHILNQLTDAGYQVIQHNQMGDWHSFIVQKLVDEEIA